ncbi:sigma-70 family RNA polymerase sigma factor [Streptomonospora wellingtoniae]|uniref:Sigma-70 family RNA polymerase sigma factor n=1 Tax=Streptomonospora wellingtoniae TaxID=3075544 RepID=A0ABU2KX07_9ACTN|nr:sigma-70 family RNA polymerase sigma factor [Streptomonospora sp. DSM 45055]MDT0303841.1 sigma-70 family RNA polymerase sigma factor [Streptomonospora sp. DSM 45055]
MSHDPGPGQDPALVAAARDGDPEAVEALLSQSLPLVYNIVGRALDGHSDVDDVVQEALLRVVHGLGRLERPEAYRSWMVAITVRLIRDWMRARQRSRENLSSLPQAEHLPDSSDFVSLTILRLNLTDQCREIAEATRWLDGEDRELLSLWWLEETGRLDRTELAEALGLSGRHAAMRVRRLKDRLDVNRGIVRALAARPWCSDLDAVADGWDGRPSPLWRKRLDRHVRACSRCGDRSERLAPVEGLLRGLPLLAPPPELYRALAESALVGSPYAAGSPADAGGDGGAHAGGGPSSAHHRPPAPGLRRARPPAARRSILVAAGAGAVATGVLVAAAVADNTPAAPQSAAPAPGPTAVRESSAAPDSPSPSPPASPTAAPSAASSSPAPAPEPETAEAAPADGKGVAAWEFGGAEAALRQSGAGWYYTWSTAHPGVDAGAGAEFVPMIWGAESVTDQALAEAEAAGPHLLGFNEPDMAEQADMSVEQALELWPRLEETGSTLGSPSVAYGADTEGGWLDRFMDGAQQRGHRVDFITVHWYGSDFRTDAAVEQLRGYLTAVHEKYGMPVWLTEYALIDFSGGAPRYPAPPEQAAFVSASADMLSDLPFLKRYAWFGLGTDESGPTTALYRSGPTPTEMGRAFQAAP